VQPTFPRLDPAPESPLSISPTDVSQFIRLEQCQRYLRLRLHMRAHGSGFLDDYQVQAQAIPPILSLSGHDFESGVESAIRERLPSTHFDHPDPVATDNDTVVAIAQDLLPGAVHVLFQPRLGTRLGAWNIRGDVDLVRLERSVHGALTVVIADIKSSTAAKVEHRLQVAFYHQMLTHILAEAGIAHEPIELAILYRGPAVLASTPELMALHEEQHAATAALFGADLGLLERIPDAIAYTDAVRELLAQPGSMAERVVRSAFRDVPFHLTMKCDGCLFNEFCMKQVAEADDLSLIPHLTEGDKSALIRTGIERTTELAALKEIRQAGTVEIDGETHPNVTLVPAPGTRELVRKASSTWPVAARLDELIHRAKLYRRSKDPSVEALSWIPGKGYGSLPYSDPQQNPNLVRIFIDVQHDFLHDRVYLLGALAVGNEKGKPHPARRRSVVRLTDGPPDTHEAEETLIRDWVADVLDGLVQVAAPDGRGEGPHTHRLLQSLRAAATPRCTRPACHLGPRHHRTLRLRHPDRGVRFAVGVNSGPADPGKPQLSDGLSIAAVGGSVPQV
jgi:hypothetical protein